MNKVLALLFAGFIALGCVACGSPTVQDSSSDTGTGAATEMPTETTPPEPSTPPVPTDPRDVIIQGLTGNELAQVKQAMSYIDTAHLSKAGLYGQLTSEYGENMTADEANNAIAKIDSHVDWNTLAVLQARSYRETANLTGNGLVGQLTSEYGGQFTPEQAKYGVANIDNNSITEASIWK